MFASIIFDICVCIIVFEHSLTKKTEIYNFHVFFNLCENLIAYGVKKFK